MHAVVCFLPHRVCYRIRLANRSWGGLRCQWREAFCVCKMMYSEEGAKPPAAHFQSRGNSIPFMTPAYCCSPLTHTHIHAQTQAPIDAHHPSSTAVRTQADWLQLHNDDKSHKHCQRHSDSKKHPLKIHPGHIASYFKHSPTPHLGPEFLWRRLMTVVIAFAVPHLFQAKNHVKCLYVLWWGHWYLAMPSVQGAYCSKIHSQFDMQLCNLSFF